LAVLALDQLSTNIVGNTEKLAATQVRADELNGHEKAPDLLSADWGGSLKEGRLPIEIQNTASTSISQ
jgi:hypothetical protein